MTSAGSAWSVTPFGHDEVGDGDHVVERRERAQVVVDGLGQVVREGARLARTTTGWTSDPPRLGGRRDAVRDQPDLDGELLAHA